MTRILRIIPSSVLVFNLRSICVALLTSFVDARRKFWALKILFNPRVSELSPIVVNVLPRRLVTAIPALPIDFKLTKLSVHKHNKFVRCVIRSQHRKTGTTYHAYSEEGQGHDEQVRLLQQGFLQSQYLRRGKAVRLAQLNGRILLDRVSSPPTTRRNDLLHASVQIVRHMAAGWQLQKADEL